MAVGRSGACRFRRAEKERAGGAFDSERQLFSDRTIGVPSIFISGKSDWGRGGQLIVDRLPARTGRWLGPNLPSRRYQTCAQVADALFRPSNGRIACRRLAHR
jgi:hypothetical protein